MIVTPEVNWIAILPELVLALGAAAVLLVEVQWKPATRVLGAISAFTLLIAISYTVLQWARAGDALELGRLDQLVAFSGMVVMDGFAVFGRFVLLIMAGLGLLAGWRLVESLDRRGAEAIALVLLATTGFSIMVASNNLVMMFLGLEIGSISLYVLAGLTKEKAKADEAAMKYFLLGSFASAIFVYGVALLYAGTGQLEILAIRQFFAQFIVIRPAVILIGLALIIVGLGFKVSAAPFHSWAPDVYQGAPAGLVGYMAAMAKIAGFLAIARILLTAVPQLDKSWLPVIAALSVLSMLVGSIVALVQGDVRRMLAYSGVAHAGFILTGIVGGATTGMLFYVTVYSIQLIGAFAVVAVVSGPGSSGSSIDEYRGLARRSPVLGAAFAVLLLGMAGLPLTSGFVAKFGVFTEAWANGYGWLVIVALLASVIAFAFYLRVIVAIYIDETEEEAIAVSLTARLVLAIAVAGTVLPGILPARLIDLAANAFPLWTIRRLLLGLAAGVVVIAVATQADAAETANSEFVIIRPDDLLEDDLYAGAIKVSIEGEIDGDLVAFAADEVVIEGTVTGSVTVVAPRVTINGSVGGALRVIARSLVVNGSIGRDIVVTAVDIQLAEGSSVGGDVLAWALDMEALGHIGQDLEGSQRTFALAGSVDGDVDISVGQLTVVDDLTVSGDLGYRSQSAAEGLDMASVGGVVVHKTPLPPNIRIRALGLFGRFLVILLLTIAALGTAWGWPSRTVAAVERVRVSPLKAWLLGAVVLASPLFLVAIGALVLALAPTSASFALLVILGPLVLAAVGVVLATSLVAGIPAVGRVGGVLFGKLEIYGATLAGSAVVGILWTLPIVGWLIPMIVLPLGLGGWYLSWQVEAELSDQV